MTPHETMDIDGEVGINRHANHPNMMISVGDHRKISSTNYRQSPQLFSPSKPMDVENNQLNGSYRKYMDESNNTHDPNNRTMNWTIRSGYFDQPNYEVMYDNSNSQTLGYYHNRLPNLKSDANVISTSGL